MKFTREQINKWVRSALHSPVCSNSNADFGAQIGNSLAAQDEKFYIWWDDVFIWEKTSIHKQIETLKVRGFI